MRLTILLRLANQEKIRTFTKENLFVLKRVMDKALAEAPHYLETIKQDQQKIVYEKIKHLNKWYTKIIGLDEVKIYQERVTDLQDQLLKTQTKRRELNTQLTEIRQNALEVQSQIQHIDRKEKFDVYCQLINDERTVLNMERSVFATFQEYDQAERDLFTAFTNAVRDSQEKQRAQLEYSKYIGVVLSIFGGFLAFVYSFFWKQDLKLYVKEQIGSMGHVVAGDLAQNMQPHLNYIKEEIVRDVTANVVSSGTEPLNNLKQDIIKDITKNMKIISLPVHPTYRKEKIIDSKDDISPTSPPEMESKVIKYVGIGLLGYVVLKLIIG